MENIFSSTPEEPFEGDKYARCSGQGSTHLPTLCFLGFLGASRQYLLGSDSQRFCGYCSGTTALAALGRGRQFIGIERDEEYVRLAESRIAASLEKSRE